MKIFYILTLVIFTALTALSQSGPLPVTGGQATTRILKFYPNPAVGSINFEFQTTFDKSYTLLIFNFIGKKVMDLKPSDKKIMIPLTDFYRGVYIFQLRDAKGNIVESGKFQVVK